jgi:hypothetical protein
MSAKRNSFVPRLHRWRRRARRVRGKLARVPRSVLIAGGAAILLATFALTNFLYHVTRKATELLFFVGNRRQYQFSSVGLRPSNCLPDCLPGKSLKSCPAPRLKIFLFSFDPNHRRILRRPTPSERGVSRSSRTLGVGCDGRNGVRREGAGRNACCGRRSRVVLTPRRWRQVGGSHSAGDGGKKARSPGRVRISRKTVAQGRPGVPVNLW